MVGLSVSVDREDGASGRGEVEGGDDPSVGLFKDGEILATGAVMGLAGLADVVVVVV